MSLLTFFIICKSKAEAQISFGKLICMYLSNPRFIKAVEDCTESITHDSTYVKSYFRRAKALIELNRFNEAKVKSTCAYKSKSMN